jgi:ribonuclease R
MVDEPSVLRYLTERAERPAKAKEIARALGLTPGDYGGLRRILRDLERKGQIYRVRKGRFAVPGRIDLVVGRLQMTRAGHGFVLRESGGADIFVPSSRLANAFDGDRVAVRIERRPRGRNAEGSVVKVLERARSKLVGTFHRSGKFGYLVPRMGALHRDVFIPADAMGRARDGEVVVARIVDWGSGHLDPVGEVIEVLGRVGEPGVDILAIVHAHELPADFPAAVMEEAELTRRRAVSEEGISDRVDLRDQISFTIDPEDAKDHDDAISVQRLGDDRWRVGVHIADVSHYVQESSAVDREAFERGTSVYLVDRVIPMLPEALSGDLCSLMPGEDRPTLSVLIDLDSQSEIVATRLVAAVIRSRHAYSYGQAQDILDGRERADAAVHDALRRLRDLAGGLRRRRRARGSLDFDLPEVRVIVNAAGEPTDVQRLLRLDTHELIEELMILTNESMTRLALKRALPFIYRVHEPPDADRIDRLREFVAKIGFPLPQGRETSPTALQKLLSRAEGRPEESMISTLVLRSMKQARYSNERQDHFGLASHAYTHFTSPIRRYPDLMVHRILRRAVLEGKPVPREWEDSLADIAAHSSLRERQAMEAERESVELKKIEYMERHLGDVFEGTVSGVAPFGLFVLLDDVLVEGLVHVSHLLDDYYHFVEAEYSLVGEVRRRSYRLGDRLRVQVVSVDRESQKLDLGLAENQTLETAN